MESFIGQIDWSEVGGFVMAVVFVVYIFERAWKLYKEAAGKNKHNKDDDPGRARQRCIPTDVDVRAMAQQVSALHEMHEVFDDDGVRLWYVRRSFYQMMENSSEALQKISAILPMLLDNQQKMDKRLEEIQHTQRKEQ